METFSRGVQIRMVVWVWVAKEAVAIGDQRGYRGWVQWLRSLLDGNTLQQLIGMVGYFHGDGEEVKALLLVWKAQAVAVGNWE